MVSNVIKIDFVKKKKKVDFSLDHLITENVSKKFQYLRSNFSKKEDKYERTLDF